MNDETRRQTEAIRAEIDRTRRRLDDAWETLGRRPNGAPLADETLESFSAGADEAIPVKPSSPAGDVIRAVVGAVKRNPLPILAVAGGAAWLAYEARRDARHANPADDANAWSEDEREEPVWELDLPATLSARRFSNESGGSLARAREALAERAASATGHIKDTLKDAGEKVRGELRAAGERASEIGARAKERARDAWKHSHDRAAAAVDRHPLELGLGLLGIGVVAGLLLPTPQRVHRIAGPGMDRLRTRARTAARDLMDKGVRVAEAAVAAAADEARSQGFKAQGPASSGDSRACRNDDPSHAPPGV